MKQRITTKFRVKILYAAPIAAAAGLLFFTAFPGAYLWINGFIAPALLGIVLWGQKMRHGAWLGGVFGALFWLPLIDWLSLYLGPIPWLALSGAMIFWFVLFGMTFSFVSTKFNGLNTALAFASLWAVREIVQSGFPYDGFAWGRLAHTQADGPLLSVVSWVGFTGLSWLIAFLAILPVAMILKNPSFSFKKAARFLLVTVVSVTVLVFIPIFPLEKTGSLNILGVQGNSKSGVFDDRENGDVIADHIRVTEEWIANNPNLAAEVDVVVWPENSAEFNVLWNSHNFQAVKRLAAELEAPFVVGSVLGEDVAGERRYTNSSVMISGDSNVIERYDKRYPVPFAEYMPHRSFYRALVPDLVDLVQLEYQHGTTPTTINVEGIKAGIAICFDIVFDQHASTMAQDQAEIIFAQTNNADFGKTVQSDQQLKIAKLRAVQMGRDLINISTVATSQIIASNGAILAETEKWEPGTVYAQADLYEGKTAATLLGGYLSILFTITAFLYLIVGFATRIRTKRQITLKG